MILLFLAGVALACDPIDWEVATSWPRPGQRLVPDDVAPLVVIAGESAESDVSLVSAETGQSAAGELLRIPAGGDTLIHRFVPAHTLPPGHWNLVVTPRHGPDILHLVEFEVSRGGGPDLFDSTIEEIVLGDLIEGEDSCGAYRYRELEVHYTIPEAAWAIETLVTVHAAMSPGGPISGGALQWRPVEALGEPITLQGDPDAEEICLAVRMWGTRPEHDADGFIKCVDVEAEDPNPDPDPDGDPEGVRAECSCATGGSPGWLAALLGLALLARRRVS